jgi:hypothetical protein
VLESESLSISMPSMPLSKRRMLGLSGAAIWLIAVSTAFTALSLFMIGTSAARLALISFAVAAVVYLLIGAGVIRKVLRSPGVVPPRTHEERVIMRRFVPVVIGEVVALMIVNTVCAVMRRLEPIVPLDVLIVGVHFLPLARIFRVSRYLVMGGLFCLVSVLTMVLVPVHAQVGAAGAWFVIPAFGCTPVAWATAALNLRETRQSVHEGQTPPAAM